MSALTTKIFALLCLVFFSGTAHAAEKLVVQAGETFLDASHLPELETLKASRSALKKAALQELDLKAGDSVSFSNNDTVAHNVYSQDFDLKKQEPGDVRSVKFEKKGEYEVKCMIHPKMKFKVKVE